MKRAAPVPIHKPVIVTDGGPWAMHDQACYICREAKAVLNLGTGIFEPCWKCQEDGWRVYRVGQGWRRTGWRRGVLHP